MSDIRPSFPTPAPQDDGAPDADTGRPTGGQGRTPAPQPMPEHSWRPPASQPSWPEPPALPYASGRQERGHAPEEEDPGEVTAWGYPAYQEPHGRAGRLPRTAAGPGARAPAGPPLRLPGSAPRLRAPGAPGVAGALGVARLPGHPRNRVGSRVDRAEPAGVPVARGRRPGGRTPFASRLPRGAAVPAGRSRSPGRPCCLPWRRRRPRRTGPSPTGRHQPAERRALVLEPVLRPRARGDAGVAGRAGAGAGERSPPLPRPRRSATRISTT